MLQHVGMCWHLGGNDFAEFGIFGAIVHGAMVTVTGAQSLQQLPIVPPS